MTPPSTISLARAGCLLLLGVAFGLILGILVPARMVGGWCLDPCLLIPPLFLSSVTVSMLSSKSEGGHFWLSLGAVLAVGPHLATRPGMGPVELSFTDPANLWATLGMGASLALLGLWVKFQSLRDPRSKPVALHPRLLPIAWVLSVLFFLGYRLSHQLLSHIPNEERSLMFEGVEVHHLNLGLLGLILAGYLRVFGLVGPLQRVGVLVYGLGAALFLDESVYICLDQVTDVAYSGPVSTWGGAAAVALWVLGSDQWVRHSWSRGSLLTRGMF